MTTQRSLTATPIRLRYAGTCSKCAESVPAETKAWWNPQTRAITCTSCQSLGPAPGTPSEPAVAEPTWEVTGVGAIGTGGGSALLEFEKWHQRREARIDQRWGRLAGVVKFLSDDPQSTKAWAKGSEGERRLAAHLLSGVGERAVLLNDRRVPGRRGASQRRPLLR